MRKNIIVIGISLLLIATTTIPASSSSTISSYETKEGFQTSSQKEIQTKEFDQQIKTFSSTADDPKRGGGFGLIGDSLVSTFEWGQTKGGQTQSLRLGTSEYYLITSNGDTDNDLYLTTIHVENDNGIITSTIVDTWEIGPDAYMQSPGTYLCHVTGDIYAVTYQHNTGNNILKTFSASSTTGVLQKTPIDTFTLSNRSCSQSMIRLTPTLFVIASQKIWNNSNTGYLETVYISPSGDIGNSVNDTQQFSTYTEGLTNPAIQLCSVDSDTIAIIYTGVGTDGYLVTYNISSTGAIQDTNASWWEYEGTYAATPNLIKIANDYYILVYSDSTTDGMSRVFRISNLGSITRSWIDAFKFDIADCWYPQISYCGNTSWNTYWYAITYRGTSGDGFISIVEITKSGYLISDSVIDTLEFDTMDCQWTPSLLFINETYYLLVYPGADSGTDGSDGWAATINIYTNNQPPIISNPFPANQAITIDPNPKLSVSVNDADRGGLDVTWYSNSTGPWISFGKNNTGISPVLDQFEYDQQEGRGPDIIHLGTSEYYLVAVAGDTGTDSDGFLRTFKAWNSNGTIKKTELDRWEYDDTDGADPSIVHIIDDIYAIAYRDITADRAKVFTARVWDENGTIQKSMIDMLPLSNDGSRVHIIKISGDFYAVTYTEAGVGTGAASNDGFIETIQISNNGLISDTVLSTAEYDTADAYNPRLMMIDDNTILICYQGTSTDGFIRTYNISSLGIFINTTSDIWEFDPSDGYYPNVVNVGTNRYAIAYRSTGRMYIRTIYIADTGMITKSFTDSLIFNHFTTGTYTYIRTTKIIETNNQYLIIFTSSPNSQLMACTVNISQDGIIDDDPIDKTRIIDLGTPNIPNFVNIAPMGNGFYLLVYEGLDNDGYLSSIKIAPSASGLVKQVHTGFYACGTRYWWRVNVTDGKFVSTQTFSFTTQYAPNANNDIFTVNEDTTTQFTVLTNDNDPEGHPLTIISVDDPPHGTTSISGSTVTYISDLNYNGPDLFTYTISDGHGGTDQASVSVTVNPVNDGPDAIDDAASVAEDTSNNQINVLTNDGDIDGDSLVITAVSVPSHGTTTFTSSFVRYTPSANYNGPDSFTYSISDGHGGTDTATVTVTVTPVNDQPIANNDTATVNEDSTNNQINVLTNDGDIDNDPILISGVTQPAHGAVTFTISTIFYTPSANYNGGDNFTYTIIDGYGGIDTATVTVTITPINDPPNAVDDTTTVAEDTNNNQINVRTNDNDIDGDTLSITSVTTPAHGTATFTTLYTYYSPSSNYNGPDSFTYTITDGHGGTDTATVSVTVTPVNDQPVANDDTATVIEDSLNNNINVLVNDIDIDGDPLTITSITQPMHGLSTFTASSVTYRPAANYSGSDSFTYTISDGHGGTDPATVNVIITPVNDPPDALNDTATIPEDSTNYPINVRLNDIDVDGDILTIVSLTQPIHGTASTNGTRVFYTASLNYFGPDSLTYTISDNNGGTDTATLFITVTSVNDPPVAVNDAVTLAEDSTNNLINALVNDFDIENNPLTIASVTQPSHGAASTSGGYIFYTPAANYNGQDAFTYTISDGNGGTSIGTISITVTPMNDPPNATNDTATVAEDSSNNLINALANDNDPDGDSLSIASVSNPPHGSTTTNGNYVFYTPDPNYFSIDTFSYTMSDGHGGTDTATVTVTVAPISDPPIANDDTITVPKDSSNNQLNVRANDYDPDNNPLTITSVSTPLHGSASTNGLYVFYTPTAGYLGSDSCSYTISDGTGNTDTAVISLTIAIINTPPNANDDTATVVEDSSGNQLNTLTNDNDPNGDSITIIGVTQPLHGTVSFMATYVTYTPTPNYYGLDTFTYTISDGGSTDSARVNVTIQSVNDLPVAANDTATVSEDSTNNQLNVQANDMDEDGDTLIITTVTTPSHGSVTFTNFYVTYTPAQNYTGMDAFIYTIIDGHGGSDTAVVTVTVTAINDPPTAIDDITVVTEDSATNQLNVRAND
ncbi:MAG: Ig-like domain-containing protein, partial [Euryarchaeota archaeon]|nr:Ig-like domain-containing protein [Euryarchaeota archaeon]